MKLLAIEEVWSGVEEGQFYVWVRLRLRNEFGLVEHDVLRYTPAGLAELSAELTAMLEAAARDN